jgi:hypothetical protein
MKLRIVFGILTMLTLAACGNNKVGTISGTVTAPDGQTVTNTTVAFCVVKGNREDCGDANSKVITITTSGSSATFTSPDLLTTEKFIVFASKDVDDNGEIDIGDLLGEVQLSIQPPKTGINLRMFVFED